MRYFRLALKIVLCILLGVVVYGSNDPFLMVSGSDSTSLVVGPAAAVQWACSAVFVVCLLVPAGTRTRAALVPAAVAAALLASHRLVIDNLRGEIRDVYVLTSVQRLPLDLAAEGGLAVQPEPAGFRVGQAGSPASIRVISPPAIGLDQAAVSRLEG